MIQGANAKVDGRFPRPDRILGIPVQWRSVILKLEFEICLTERYPNSFAAPANVNDLLAVGK